MFTQDYKCKSYVRVLHASPGAPAVDVYVNNQKIASDLQFKNLSCYEGVKPGNYTVKVFAAGQTVNPILRRNVTIKDNSAYTIAAINRPRNLDLKFFNDPVIQNRPARNTAFIRVAHLSPNAPAVDVKLNRRELFNNVRYKDITRYRGVNPGTYNLNIFADNQRVLSKNNIVLQSGFYYTSYILGLVNDKPPLQIIVPIDGLY